MIFVGVGTLEAEGDGDGILEGDSFLGAPVTWSPSCGLAPP